MTHDTLCEKCRKITNINQVENVQEIMLEKRRFRILLQDADTGEIYYDKLSHGGVFCSSESYQINPEEKSIEDVHQGMFFGHPLIAMHCKMELDKQFEKTSHILRAGLEAFAINPNIL